MAKKRPNDPDSVTNVESPDPLIQEIVKSDEDARFYAAAGALAKTANEPVLDEKPVEMTEIVSQNVPFAPEVDTFVTYASATIEDHLKIIDEYRSITVPTFRDLTLSGREAVTILAGYVADGLVERSWQSGYGIYSLTPAGKQFIASS